MKLKVLATGLALAFPLSLPLTASAQSTSATLYGTVASGVEYVNNISKRADGSTGKSSSVHFNNLTNNWPSQWGLRGSEDLGGGLSAVFTIESGFNTGTGTSGQGGRLFGRQAFVGLKGEWGQLAFGRQYNMLNVALRRADFLGPNIFGLASLDVYIPNARMDNAITYTGSFDGFQVGAAWARGRDTVDGRGPAATGCGVNFQESSTCQAYSFMLGYNTSDWGVAAAYDVITGRDRLVSDGATPPVFTNEGDQFYGLKKGDDDTRWMLNGWVKVAPDWKLSLIYMNRKSDRTDATGTQKLGINNAWSGGWGQNLGEGSNLWSVNFAWQATPEVLVDGSVNYMDFKDARTNYTGTGTKVDSNAWLYIVRSQYFLSKRTSLYAQASYIKNKGYASLAATSGTSGTIHPKQGGNQTALGIGLRHNF